MASLHDITVGQDIELKRVLAKAGWDSEFVETLIRTPDMAADMTFWARIQMSLRSSFKLRVRYTDSLEDIIHMSRRGFQGVSREITNSNYPMPSDKRGMEEVEAVLLHFGTDMTSTDALAEMEKHNLRPATMIELVAYAIERPSLGETFTVIELGSVWTDEHDRRQNGYLLQANGRYILGLPGTQPINQWRSDCRFLAIKK
jgi:hypothetical protein